MVDVANIQGELENPDEARKILDECEKTLERFDSVETTVHASFYKANAEYYKVRLQLVSSTPLVKSLTMYVRQSWILPHTTKMPSYISPASTSIKSPRQNVNVVLMISHYQPLSLTLFTTLENFFYIPSLILSTTLQMHGCVTYSLHSTEEIYAHTRLYFQTLPRTHC
jgi:hypothetical protein